MQLPSMRRKLIREIMDAKVRFLAITLVVVIGVGIFVASSLAYRNLEKSYEYTYEKLKFADFRVKAQRITPALVDDVENVEGVEKVTPRIKEDLAFVFDNHAVENKNIIGRVTGITEPGNTVDDLLIEEGSAFEESDSMVCMAESHFAEFYDIKPGDTIFFEKRGVRYPVEVVGIAASPEYIVLAGEKGDFSPMLSATTMAILWMPINDVRWMAGKPIGYNELLFRVDDPDNMSGVIEEVEKILVPSSIKEVITREDHTGNQMLKMDLEGFKSFAMFFPMLFLGIACFSIYILLSRLVYTQRPFIGVMRAIGYTKRQIMVHYLSFAFIIGVLGAVFGVILGYFLAYTITGVYADTLGIPLFKVHTVWSVIFEGMFLSMFFCLVAGIVPAYSSARQKPSIAMRGESMKQSFRMPLIEKVLPFISRIPLFLKVPVRNIFRTKRRTVFTVIGLIFSVMMVLIFLGILDTADNAMYTSFNISNQFDMVAVFLENSDEATTVSRIQKVPGVEKAEPTVASDCEIAWNGTSVDTMMMGLLPDTEMKDFSTTGDDDTRITERRVLLNRWFENEQHLQTGDMVTVSTDYNEKTFVIGGFIDEVMGNVIYLPQEEAKELLNYGTLSRSSFYVKARPDKVEEALEGVKALPGLATIIDLEEIKREVTHYMDFMYILVYVMLAFALVMAFTLTFNTITINILEREREIATMRTIGTAPWKISTMTSLENLIFGLLAIIQGIIFGNIVARYAIGLQETEYFSLEFVVYWPTYVIVSVGILIVLLICQIPSLKHVQSVELARATKERGG